METLCSVIEPKYDLLLTNVPLYSNRNRKIAEIDVLAIKGKDKDIYEVKCSHRVVKARHQLRKIRKILSGSSRVRDTFFYCGEAGKLLKI